MSLNTSLNTRIMILFRIFLVFFRVMPAPLQHMAYFARITRTYIVSRTIWRAWLFCITIASNTITPRCRTLWQVRGIGIQTPTHYIIYNRRT